MLKLVKESQKFVKYDKKFILFRFHHLKLLHSLLLVASFQLLTSKRKIKHVIHFVGKSELRYKNSKKHIYEQHGLHKNLDQVVMNRQCKYPVYFLVATTSGFIQVACSRSQQRKVTIEKKDEINEYTKKKKYKKKGKAKRRAYQCPPPFIMEYLC